MAYFLISAPPLAMQFQTITIITCLLGTTKNKAKSSAGCQQRADQPLTSKWPQIHSNTAQFPNEGFICAMKSWRRSTLRRCMAAISYSSSSAVALSKTGQVTRVSALTNMGFSKTINLNQSTLHCICIKEVIAFYLN